MFEGPSCGSIRSPTIPTAINDAGHVVGSYIACAFGPGEAFLWTPQAGLVTLKRPPGSSCAGAFDISNDGTIVGAMCLETQNDRPTAVMWVGGKLVELGIPAGGNHSQARGVNDAGQVVGMWMHNIFGPLQAFLWQDGQMIDLGPDLGTPNGDAWDINVAGQIVGWMGNSVLTNARAFIWDDGRVTELPPVPGGYTSEARAVNERGQVVGFGRLIDDNTGDVFVRPFLWDRGRMLNLGSLPEFLLSSASDVNNNRVVVGGVSAPGEAAFVWQNGVMRDLNDLVRGLGPYEIDGARGVNNRGQITASACDGTDTIGLVLTPIETVPGDLNCDGAVAHDDLGALLDSWGACPDCPGDLDGDGTVATTDLLILLANWG